MHIVSGAETQFCIRCRGASGQDSHNPHVRTLRTQGSHQWEELMTNFAPTSATAPGTLNPQAATDEANALKLLDRLRWRYATKKMNPTLKVSKEKVERILEAARLAPTSSGLQPFEVFMVNEPQTREKIKPIAWNQGQITESSHLLVFAAWDDYTVERINLMFDLTNTVRGTKHEGWESYRAQLLGSYPQRGAEVNFAHAARQVYIALGTALIAAAHEEVDSTPIEGFDPVALDEILDLRARGLRSVAILALGYREADQDWLVNLKKVRRARDQFVTEI